MPWQNNVKLTTCARYGRLRLYYSFAPSLSITIEITLFCFNLVVLCLRHLRNRLSQFPMLDEDVPAPEKSYGGVSTPLYGTFSFESPPTRDFFYVPPFYNMHLHARRVDVPWVATVNGYNRPYRFRHSYSCHFRSIYVLYMRFLRAIIALTRTCICIQPYLPPNPKSIERQRMRTVPKEPNWQNGSS